nr:serine hydrolase [Paenibacillus dendritiformis]
MSFIEPNVWPSSLFCKFNVRKVKEQGQIGIIQWTLSLRKDRAYEAEKGEFIMRNARCRQKIIALVAGLFLVSTLSPNIAPVQALTQAASPTSKLQRAMNAQDVEAFADEFFARRDVKALGVPGALFVVVKDGKVLLQKGYGYADAEKKVPVDPEKTLFRIASVSKVFTAAAVMQLVEQGKIELHRDVQHYLGDIQMKNDIGSPVTMEHLLTHTTGFDVVDPPVGDSISYDLASEVKLEDYVKKWMPAVTRTPGEVYKYDNMASMLQGYIVQQVAGVPFKVYEGTYFQAARHERQPFSVDAGSCPAIGCRLRA